MAERDSPVKDDGSDDVLDLADKLARWNAAAMRWYERADAQAPAQPQHGA